MKKNNVIKWTFLLAAVCVLTIPAQALAGNVYKLGLSLAITGPTSDAGNPYSKGVEDYFNYVNDTKLLGDDTIECTILRSFFSGSFWPASWATEGVTDKTKE